MSHLLSLNTVRRFWYYPLIAGILSIPIDHLYQLICRHGMEALIYSNHPRETAASSYLAIIFGRIASGIPWFLRSTAVPMQLSHQCRCWCRPWLPQITGNKVFDIRSLTGDELLLRGLSDPRIADLCGMPLNSALNCIEKPKSRSSGHIWG